MQENKGVCDILSVMKKRAHALLKRLQDGDIFVSDGAWGTQLQKRGMQPGECPELWNIERYDDVLGVASAYAASGADMIGTNSFGASRLKLSMYGLEQHAVSLNKVAAEISRRAVGPDRWVLGSIGPTGRMLMQGDTSEDEFLSAFMEQASALEAGGSDVACIETMSAIDEAELAIRAVRENTSLAVACTFTFNRVSDGRFRTMMGVAPDEMVRAMLDAGADIIGTNCGNGFKEMIQVVHQIRAVTPAHVPILVHANAGKPRREGDCDVFPETPAEMAALAPELVRAGAGIIGGCCGTTPEHIAAIAAVLRN